MGDGANDFLSDDVRMPEIGSQPGSARKVAAKIQREGNRIPPEPDHMRAGPRRLN